MPLSGPRQRGGYRAFLPPGAPTQLISLRNALGDSRGCGGWAMEEASWRQGDGPSGSGDLRALMVGGETAGY